MDRQAFALRGTEFGRGWRWTLGLLLLVTFLIRALDADQPIVENYVGRQVPTAMVARNLERGSGLLRPQLDTAPFPNYFVVEPPIYESGVVALKRATGWTLEQAGRILSALATTLAAWGLFELARRRDGPLVASIAVAAFAAFPLTIRYGRAFQPDAAMLGAVVVGMACWDQHRSQPAWYWLGAGWLAVALGVALKLTAAFLLVPLLLVIVKARSRRQVLTVCSTILPAALWYAWADHLVGTTEGSRASADNRSIWLGILGPSALFERETLKSIAWFLLVRAFTPVGAGLALIGVCLRGSSQENRDDLWWVWGISALAAMAVVAGKLHHEYYWLLIAPVAAVGVGRCLALLVEKHRTASVAVTTMLVFLCVVGVRSTWRTPGEWQGLEKAAAAVATAVPNDAWLVATEALLFQADRRGCRLEWTEAAAARAAGEWGARGEVASPLELIAYYRSRGAGYFADLRSPADNPQRKGLHDAVRRRYKVIVDRPDVIIADLTAAEMHPNAK